MLGHHRIKTQFMFVYAEQNKTKQKTLKVHLFKLKIIRNNFTSLMSKNEGK